MASCTVSPALRRHAGRSLLLLPALALLLSGCKEEKEARAPEPRPVRTVAVAESEVGETVSLTGQLGRKRGGSRLPHRRSNHRELAGVGDHVEPEQVLAKLDPQDELNSLRSAQAAVSAAEGQLVEARNTFDRQSHLMDRGFTTRALYDQARQGLRTAQARADDTQAQLQIAEDRVSFTQLRANVTGTITARSAEAGEVVQPGQTIFQSPASTDATPSSTFPLR